MCLNPSQEPPNPVDWWLEPLNEADEAWLKEFVLLSGLVCLVVAAPPARECASLTHMQIEIIPGSSVLVQVAIPHRGTRHSDKPSRSLSSCLVYQAVVCCLQKSGAESPTPAELAGPRIHRGLGAGCLGLSLGAGCLSLYMKL